MIARCTNSNCATPFDYRQGRFFRFRMHDPKGKAPANAHSVRHFWLCKACSERYTLEYRHNRCELIHRYRRGAAAENALHSVTAT